MRIRFVRTGRLQRFCLALSFVVGGAGIFSPGPVSGQPSSLGAAAPDGTPVVPNSLPPGGYRTLNDGRRLYDSPASQRQYDAFLQQQRERRSAYQAAGTTIVTVTRPTPALNRGPGSDTDRDAGAPAPEAPGSSAKRGNSEGIQIDVQTPSPRKRPTRPNAASTSISLQL